MDLCKIRNEISKGESIYNFVCYNECPNGTYDTLEKECMLCDSSCVTCNIDSNNCTSCPSGTFLFFEDDQGHCLPFRTPELTPAMTPGITLPPESKSEESHEANEGDTNEPNNNMNLYIIIGCVLAGLILVLVLAIVILKLKYNNDNSQTSSEMEISEETIFNQAEQDELSHTITSPLWTTSVMDETDIFKDDFEEANCNFFTPGIIVG